MCLHIDDQMVLSKTKQAGATYKAKCLSKFKLLVLTDYMVSIL